MVTKRSPIDVTSDVTKPSPKRSILDVLSEEDHTAAAVKEALSLLGAEEGEAFAKTTEGNVREAFAGAGRAEGDVREAFAGAGRAEGDEGVRCEVLDEGSVAYGRFSYDQGGEGERTFVMLEYGGGDDPVQGQGLVRTTEVDEYPWPSALSSLSAYARSPPPPYPPYLHPIPLRPPPLTSSSSSSKRRKKTHQCSHPLSETQTCSEYFNSTQELSCHIANLHALSSEHVCSNCAKYSLTKNAIWRRRLEHAKARSVYMPGV